MQRTTNFEEGMHWARQILGEPNVPSVWIPENGFVAAVREENSISFTRSTPSGFFGLAIGDNPILLPEWNECAVQQGVAQDQVSKSIFHAAWETHAIEVAPRSYDIEILDDSDDAELILDFLEAHAPSSSAKPGNPEIQVWGCARNNEGEIAAVAAISEWESGAKMLSSVATHTQMRGMGYAQKVSSGLIGLAYDRGIETLNLVVLSSNVAAIQAYAKVGFTLVGKFASYSRITE